MSPRFARRSWRLNERHYGAFQEESKVEMARRLGVEEVQKFRGGLHHRPPPVPPADNELLRDRKYADLSKQQIPNTEVRSV